ncbi:MAG: SDR family NAD(P)-dependent oxidoreductase, partial [Actinomycetota bacterium]
MAANEVHFDFTGANVLVTGGSNGIGLGIAQAFATAGAHVTITGTRQSAADYDHDLSSFDYAQCSMSDASQLTDLASKFSQLDVLVNNAGQVMPHGGNEYDPDVFDQ